MKKNKQNKEFQSRREFFKDAAKKALPIIGAIALASSHIVAQTAFDEPMSCSDSDCKGGCYNGCYGDCEGSCKSCCGGCSGACKGTCKNCSS